MDAGDYERSQEGDEEDQEEEEEVTYTTYKDEPEYEYDEEAEARRGGYFSIYAATGFLHGVTLLVYLIIGAVFFKKFEEGEMATSLDNLQNAQDGLYWTLDNAKKSLKNGLGPHNKKEFIETISRHLADMEMKWEVFHRKRQGDGIENVWTYFGSFIFCSSVVTTIGWGNIAPRTNVGRIGCIVFAVFGIPIFFGFAVMLSNISNTACQMLFKGIERVMGRNSGLDNKVDDTIKGEEDTNVNKSENEAKNKRSHVSDDPIAKRCDVFKTLHTMPQCFKARVENGVLCKIRNMPPRLENHQRQNMRMRTIDSTPLISNALILNPSLTYSKSCHTISTAPVYKTSVHYSKSDTHVISLLGRNENNITRGEGEGHFRKCNSTLIDSIQGSWRKGNYCLDSVMMTSNKPDSVKFRDITFSTEQRRKDNNISLMVRSLIPIDTNQNAEEDDDDDDDDDSNLFDDEPEEDEPSNVEDNVPFIVYSSLFLIYLLIGGYLFEDLDTRHTLINGVYFTFIMLTTIGFGDIVPLPEYYVAMLIYGALGLSLTNLITNMIIDKIVDIVDTVNSYWENKASGDQMTDQYGYGEYEEGEDIPIIKNI